jgi:hypothetical protein
MAKPVIFIHGLWLHATSGRPWLDLIVIDGSPYPVTMTRSAFGSRAPLSGLWLAGVHRELEKE